jgi:hypothetical protein
MNDWDRHLEEDRRLALLRVLEAHPAFRANDSVLGMALDRVGHVVSRDRVRSDIAWLDEQGLITREIIADGRVHVATLTQRGIDVAMARSAHPGVKRPSPG